MEDLNAVNVDYDWKDVSDVSCFRSCDVSCVGDLDESFVSVSGSVMALTDSELRQR